MTQSMTMHVHRQTSHLIWAWAALVALTIASWWFRDHGLGPQSASVVILIITFIKVYVVGRSFMELRRAPVALQRVFIAWCAGTCASLIAFVLWF
jgi:prolipoprotein diacylglyceryltransferase